jgi:hypothetical protein
MSPSQNSWYNISTKGAASLKDYFHCRLIMMKSCCTKIHMSAYMIYFIYHRYQDPPISKKCLDPSLAFVWGIWGMARGFDDGGVDNWYFLNLANTGRMDKPHAIFYFLYNRLDNNLLWISRASTGWITTYSLSTTNTSSPPISLTDLALHQSHFQCMLKFIVTLFIWEDVW